MVSATRTDFAAAAVEPAAFVPDPALAWIDGQISENRRAREAEEARAERLAAMTAKAAAGADAHCTDLGNAGRFAAQHHERARWVSELGWLVFDGAAWRRDAGAAQRLAKEIVRSIYTEAAKATEANQAKALAGHAMRSESARAITAMLALAQSEAGISAKADLFDRDAMLLNCPNATVDLRIGQAYPNEPTDHLTKVTGAEFDADAVCPLWLRFLREIMNGNVGMIGFLQRLGGYCLTADIREQILPILWGTGANGKTVFCETLLGLLGGYAAEAPPTLLTLGKYDEHPTEIADLFGKRLIIASETERSARLRVQLVKKLTGDQYLKARYMRQDFFQFSRTHKTILVTNNRPVVSENTLAIWRRLKLVPFTVSIPPEEQDTRLAQRLRAEWPGILAWAVRGCLDWLRDGLGEPPEVTQATTEYRAEQDHLSDFWESRCVFAPDAFTSRAVLYANYLTWAERNNETPVDRTTLFEETRKHPNLTEHQQRVAGQMTRGFRGLGLLP